MRHSERIPAPGKEVWGAVYEVCDEDLHILDGFEDGYRREILPVYRLEERSRHRLRCWFISPNWGLIFPLPNAEYKRLILEGAKHWNLPGPLSSILEEIQAALIADASLQNEEFASLSCLSRLPPIGNKLDLRRDDAVKAKSSSEFEATVVISSMHSEVPHSGGKLDGMRFMDKCTS